MGITAAKGLAGRGLLYARVVPASLRLAARPEFSMQNTKNAIGMCTTSRLSSTRALPVLPAASAALVLPRTMWHRAMSSGEGGGNDGGIQRVKGEAKRWNSERGFGFIKPNTGGEDVFCHFSSITDGNALREGDIVEYEAEFDESKGKYRAVEVTGGIKEDRGARGGGGYGSHTDSYLLVKHSAAYFNTLMHSAAYLCVWACL